ncbi:MAG: N-acetylmuramoyl-L-alanine amidase, partial [Bacteroidota bacterium]
MNRKLKINNIANKRLYILVLLQILLIFVNANLNADGTEKYKIKTVVIDAGHGGKDPGAVCSAGYEKDLVLDIALKVGKYIEENIEGVKVIYTRDDDTFVELYKRAKIANEAKADVFISIHANANESSKPLGAETYVMGLSKSQGNLEVAKKENSVILQEDNYIEQYEGFDPNSAESQIIFTLYQNAYRNQSLDIASKVQHQFNENVKRVDRGVKQEGFLVLWKTTMPSILIEIGFISNPDEAKFLFSDEGKDYMSSAIYRAFKEYKKEYDKKIEEEYKDE